MSPVNVIIVSPIVSISPAVPVCHSPSYSCTPDSYCLLVLLKCSGLNPGPGEPQDVLALVVTEQLIDQ